MTRKPFSSMAWDCSSLRGTNRIAGAAPLLACPELYPRPHATSLDFIQWEPREGSEKRSEMAATTEKATGSPLDAIAPGIKLTAQLRPEPEESDLQWLAQMGIGHVVMWTNSSKSSAEYYASRKALCAEHGITVYGFGNSDVHNQDAIVLGLENRDAKIEEYKRHLQSLGAAGIPYTTYAHMANGIWSSERETTRGGASARGLDMESPAPRGAGGARSIPPPPHQRAGVLGRGAVGPLRVLHPPGGPGGRGGRGDDRDPPGRPAGADPHRRRSPASSLLSSATRRPWTSRGVPTWGSASAWAAGWRGVT